MNRINIQPIPFHPNLTNVSKTKTDQPSNTKFSQLLEQYTSVEPLKISKHATERMNARDIQISDTEWSVIEEKIAEAKTKGVNQPLVLLDHAALIVSAKNNTVITALDRSETQQQLFTNIDGTIVL